MEQFEPIKEFETYGINRLGQVKDFRTGKIIKPYQNRDGYHCITLKNPQGQKGKFVHRLMAIQFIPLTNGKNEVDHIDRNKTNNNLDNLRWADDFDNNNNRGIMKNNKLNEKYICFEKNQESSRYRVQITKLKKKLVNKSFNTRHYTLQDAIDYRNQKLSELGIE